jgi:hydrogenase-4 component F
MVLAVVIAPLAAAALALLLPSDHLRPLVLPVLGAAHLGLVVVALGRRSAAPEGWIGLDALGGLTLALVSVLFLLCSLYAPSYLRLRRDRPNRVFCACVALFLGMVSLLSVAQHLGLMWVAVEATTLATAPLIYFNRNQLSIEATWKYLLVGSVGIAIALLGSFFLSYAAYLGAHDPSLLFGDLVRHASGLSRPWLRSAFVFLLVGYGTKLGLAPLHTWKPDAYGEAPGMVGALLAGGATSAAFLALLRVYRIVNLGGEGDFARRLLVWMGLFSMLWVAVFMARQRDVKRMLAYSSVEQMGILLLGIGVGGTFGSLLHMLNTGLIKGVMFLAAGNIHRAFGSKRVRDISGAMRRLPLSGTLFLVGLFAVTGSPPFGTFVSQFAILRATVADGRFVVAGLFLLLLAAVFLGMGSTVLAVSQGEPPARALRTPYRDDLAKTAPLLGGLALVLVLGLWLPGPLERLLREAATALEVGP